jgi:hypothetical protein
MVSPGSLVGSLNGKQNFSSGDAADFEILQELHDGRGACQRGDDGHAASPT